MKIEWIENEQTQQALWLSTRDVKAPQRFSSLKTAIATEKVFALLSQGTAIVWRGDYHQGKQVLSSVARWMDKKNKAKAKGAQKVLSPQEQFNAYRMQQAQRARVLGLFLLPFDADFVLNLARAPQLQDAIRQVWPDINEASLISLRDVMGLVGAYEWQKNGVFIKALGQKIYPYYGVFSPIRGEYLDLVNQAPLPENTLKAFDIGTGTGVIAAILAKRGIKQVIATDNAQRAVDCAQFTIQQLGLQNQVLVQHQAFFPNDTADLIVCNPPWLPAKAGSSVEAAVYDEKSVMLKGFLSQVLKHLTSQGRVWLIMSDLAEHLGLRQANDLSSWIDEAGLVCEQRLDIKPTHDKTLDATNPLYFARSKELTSLWILKAK